MKKLVSIIVLSLVYFLGHSQTVGDYDLIHTNDECISKLIQGTNKKDSSLLRAILTPQLLKKRPGILDYLFSNKRSLQQASVKAEVRKTFIDVSNARRDIEVVFVNNYKPEDWAIKSISYIKKSLDSEGYLYFDYIDNFLSFIDDAASGKSKVKEYFRNDVVDLETLKVLSLRPKDAAEFKTYYLLSKHAEQTDSLIVTTSYIGCQKGRLTCGWKVTDIEKTGGSFFGSDSPKTGRSEPLASVNQDLLNQLDEATIENKRLKKEVRSIEASLEDSLRHQKQKLNQYMVDCAQERSMLGDQLDSLNAILNGDDTYFKNQIDSLASSANHYMQALDSVERLYKSSLLTAKSMEQEVTENESGLMVTDFKIITQPIPEYADGEVFIEFKGIDHESFEQGFSMVQLFSQNPFTKITNVVMKDIACDWINPSLLKIHLSNNKNFLSKKDFKNGPLSIQILFGEATIVNAGIIYWDKGYLIAKK